MSERIKPIDRVTDIPTNLSDEEMIDFLDERGVSEEFLENAPEAPEDERPIPRTKPINVRFDDFTLSRLKQLADRRGVGYQTLLKQFVTERLYEEERRMGCCRPGGRPGPNPPENHPKLSRNRRRRGHATGNNGSTTS